MTKVIAAIDSSAVSRTVLDRAVELARLLDLQLEALHVRDDGATTARSCAEALGVSLDERSGDPAETVLAAGGADDVAVLAFGARDHELGPRPTGHVTHTLLTTFMKPCLVIPPETRCTGPLRRLVVALEADLTKARALDAIVRRADQAGAELILLHVDDEASLPSFSDQVQYETEAYEREFLRRYASELRNHPRLELRVGDPAQQMLDLAEDVDADLLVLSWRGALDGGRAPVVHELLTHVRIPLLLVPTPVTADAPKGAVRRLVSTLMTFASAIGGTPRENGL